MGQFTFIDLFAGIGGFRSSLDKLGGTCVFASEIDKFAAKAYETLYGEAPAGDITEIDAVDIPEHDLLVGGFPCQSFSLAGKRKGLEDARGTLFFDIARIADEKQPKALLLENVKGLVNHDKGNTLDLMVRTLNEIGYVVDFDVLNSKYFGVPQNRERIFIIAIRKDLIASEPFSEEATTGQTVVPKGKRRIGEWADVFNFDWPEQGEVTTRLRDILEPVVDEKYYLDEEKTAKLVAQLEEDVDDYTAHCGYNGKVHGDGKVTPTLTGNCGYGYRNGVNLIEPQMVGHVDLKGHDAIKRTYSTEGISPTLTTMGGGHREPKIAEPTIQMVGHADIPGHDYNKRVYHEDGISRTLNTASDIGRSVKVAQEEVRPILTPDRAEKRQNGRRFKEDDEESFTLTAQDKHGVALGNKPRYRIRKLTPKECFRLQAFPDEAHQALVDAGISDSQRYKMSGNAVTVSVIEAIGERLIPLISQAEDINAVD